MSFRIIDISYIWAEVRSYNVYKTSTNGLRKR